MALRLRRGTNAERLTVTPESGEIIYVTDTKKLYVGDGSTVGGNLVSGVNNIVDDATPELGGDLDLNGNNIIGNGNINITGTITATGNINLGDGAGGDVISVGGDVSGDLIPSVDESFRLGSAAKRWMAIWSSSVSVSGNLTAETITGDIVSDDSTVVFDSSNNTFTGEFVGNITGDVTGNLTGNANGAHTGTLDGDVTGSVFGDDSSLIVDGVSNSINATEATVDLLNVETVEYTLNLEGPRARFIGSGTFGVIELRNDNGAAALADDATVGRVLFGEDSAGAYWTLEGTKNFLNVFPNPTGTPDYGKFIQFWKDGRLQIRGETGGSGFDGISRPPASVLEVYGDATIGDILIDQNNITTTDSNANLKLGASGSGTIELDVPTQTTVGAAGAANALPATPSTYFKINVGGTDYVVPAYAVS